MRRLCLALLCMSATVGATEPAGHAAQDAVRQMLKDPESARFRSVASTAHVTPRGEKVYVCGEVNAKNSFGGYVGFRHFYAIVSSDGVVADIEPPGVARDHPFFSVREIFCGEGP